MYIDAFYNREEDRILIAERINGKRVLRRELPEYVFYYDHPQGTYRSIFDDCVKKYATHDAKKFRGEVFKKKNDGHKLFESDSNAVFRYLANHYMGAELPTPIVGFFDIEVDFDATRGYAPPDNPYSPVTAITLFNSHTTTLHTLALCPPTLTMQEGQAIIDEVPSGMVDTTSGKVLFETELFDNEIKLLEKFLDLIEDVDIISGWHSEGFDVPYLVNRIALIMGKEATARFCLWDQLPKDREYIKFGKPFKTYELVGRVHLDYLLLYQKHNTQQQHSYRLDFIGEIEVGENKVPYEGTLDDLYKKDFKRFVEYSQQDVMLLVKIDQKKKFIGLANQIAHENCVLFKTTMGSVSLVETAMINAMHAMGYVVPDKKPKDGNVIDDDEDDEERTPVVGAYVAKPKPGMFEHIGCVDINSLYPSAIRALNMSPETIVGQVRLDETMALIEKRIATGTPRAEAWEGIFETLEVGHMRAQDDVEVTVDFENGNSQTMTGLQLYNYIFNPKNYVCITANGTIFSTKKEGILPKLLGDWYAERKQMQTKASSLADEIYGLEIDENLAKSLRGLSIQ